MTGTKRSSTGTKTISSGFVEEKRSPMASMANVREFSPILKCWRVRKKPTPRATLRTVESAGKTSASLLPMDRSQLKDMAVDSRFDSGDDVLRKATK